VVGQLVRLRSVLSIGKLAGSPEAGRYYTDAVAKGREDYYQGSGEAPGAWAGAGAQLLDLDGRVDDEHFGTLLRGVDPKSGTPLRSARGPSRTAGFDLTFSAPKSVSVLFGIADEEIVDQVRRAHDEAVTAALGYLEREATFTRRGTNGREVLRGEGLVVAAFRHRTSRAGDPQLHTHAVVANTTFAAGAWSTLDSRSIHRHAKTAGYLYHAALRHQISQRLGLAWGPMAKGTAEIRGIDERVIRHFSRRRVEIEERMDERGEHTRAASRTAALATRKRKDYAVPADRLREEWRARAAEHGIAAVDLQMLLQRRSLDPGPDLDLAARAIGGMTGVTKGSSTFDRRDVLRSWCERHTPGAPVERVEQLTDRWLSSPHATRLEEAKPSPTSGPRYSTPSMLQTEQELVHSAKRRLRTGVAVADVAQVGATLTERPELSGEQQQAVRALTTSGDGIQVLRAAAGTGKTYALEAARAVWEASEQSVVGCALSARAARELQEQTAIPSITIANLLGDLSQGWAPEPCDVLVVDEAGMVGTRAMAQLSRHAEQADVKLVLVGDDRQLPEIDAGGALAGISKRIGALELHDVRRQEHEWDRDALAALRHGNVSDWARAYREHDRIHTAPTPGKVRERMVDDWWQHAKTGSDAVMIAHRRSDVADLNRRARERMHADRRLGDSELTFGERTFAQGDRVLARRNDHQLAVTNGTRASVTSIDPSRRALVIQPDKGEPTTLDAEYLDSGHLDHAYATTAHALQGASVDHAFILGTDDLYREWGYTALTRHRQAAHFYLHSHAQAARPLPGLEPEPDPIEGRLREILGKRRHKSLAIDLGPRGSHVGASQDRDGAASTRTTSALRAPVPTALDGDDLELAGLLAGLRALSGGRERPGLEAEGRVASGRRPDVSL